MDIKHNNGTNRVSYILKIQVNDKYHVFNRHSETDYLNKPEIEYFYDEVPMAYFEDAGIEILEVVDVPNYNCEDQHYLDQKKEYWNKKIGITSTYIDEDKEYHKLCRMQMKVLKDLYAKKMEWKKKATYDLSCCNQDSYRIMKTLQKLYYNYYIKDNRYQHCNRIKYLSSVRLSVEEKWLFVLFKRFFNNFPGSFKISNILREVLYTYLQTGAINIGNGIYSGNPNSILLLCKIQQK